MKAAAAWLNGTIKAFKRSTGMLIGICITELIFSSVAYVFSNYVMVRVPVIETAHLDIINGSKPMRTSAEGTVSSLTEKKHSIPSLVTLTKAICARYYLATE